MPTLMSYLRFRGGPWVVSLTLLLAACGGGGEFEIPDSREEQLALLDAKQHEIRVLRAEVAQLEEAIGGIEAGGKARLVAAVPVEAGAFSRETELQATVESEETGVVTVEVPGRVTRVLVDEGQYVRRGQTLLQVDVASVGLQIAELQTQLDLARDLAARQERLRAQNIGTEVQLLEARNAVERLEKSLEQLRVQQGKGIVRAPISGTVENKMINTGEYAAPGVPLMQILDAATVKVVADVPETYLTSVKEGTRVRVTFPTIGETRQARITDIGRTIDPANRTFRVELALPNPQRLFKPNMLANVYLVDYARDNVVTVPSETILAEVDGREYVYIAEPVAGQPGSYVARKSYVTTGENDALRREIRSGLAPGQLLINRGMRSVVDGQTIRLDGEQPPAATASQADTNLLSAKPTATATATKTGAGPDSR